MKGGNVLLGLLLFFVPLYGMAQWSTDPAINTAVSTITNDQTAPVIVTDGAGGAIIAWQDHRNGNDDIYAQRIGADGTLLWSPSEGQMSESSTEEGIAISRAAGNQRSPAIVSDGAGGAIIAWEDLRTGTLDIYAQHVSAGGFVQWTIDGIAICAAENGQQAPTIASDGAGGAIITWSDGRSGSGWDIYAQRVNAGGTLLWIGDGAPVCAVGEEQSVPTIASDGAGGAIITWIDGRGGLRFNIYAQRVDSGGLALWTTNGVPICESADAQVFPTIASDDSGGAIIVWQDLRHVFFNDIYAQRIDAGGTVRWHENGVEICTAGGGQTHPFIVPDDSGGAIMTWTDDREVTQTDIYAQRIDRGGTPRWHDNGVRICTAGGNQSEPALTPDGDGGVVIAWRDRRGEHSDVYAQRINRSGEVQWNTNGVPVSTAADGQVLPAIVYAGGGRTIIAWEDHRSGAPDIYAQLLDRGGLLAHQDPVYAVPYRTATYTEWSQARDSKGKQKAEKRKTYQSEAWFDINPADGDADSSIGVLLEFNAGVTTLEVGGAPSAGTPTPALTPDGKVKKFVYAFAAPVAKNYGQMLRVHVIGGKGKPFVLKKYWWVPKGTVDPMRYKDPVLPAVPALTTKQWLHMPNFINVGEEVFGATGLPSQFPTGLLVGVPQGIKQANAVNHVKYNDILKSMTKKGRDSYTYHTVDGRCLCMFDGATPRPIKSLQKSLPPHKHNNVLFANLVALKLNIAAADLGAFPGNFGDLIYAEYPSAFEGMSVAEIAAEADAIISSCVAPPEPDELAYLRTVLERLNAAFSGAYDTTSFGTRTVVTAARQLGDVWFLVPPAAGAIARTQPVTSGFVAMPMEYALEQNYPNPFNPTTTIEFTLPAPSVVTLSVYNALGQEAASLVHNEMMDEGVQEVEFDASALASGVYFYRLMATPQVNLEEFEEGSAGAFHQGAFVSVRKMLLIR
jgi:hypothetical protein